MWASDNNLVIGLFAVGIMYGLDIDIIHWVIWSINPATIMKRLRLSAQYHKYCYNNYSVKQFYIGVGFIQWNLLKWTHKLRNRFNSRIEYAWSIEMKF